MALASLLWRKQAEGASPCIANDYSQSMTQQLCTFKVEAGTEERTGSFHLIGRLPHNETGALIVDLRQRLTQQLDSASCRAATDAVKNIKEAADAEIRGNLSNIQSR